MDFGIHREHDVEAAVPKVDSVSSNGSKSAQAIESSLPKTPLDKNGPELPGSTRKHIPDIRDLSTTTRILLNLVAADNVDGAKLLLDAMQADQKSDGFTIQNVDGDGLLQMAALHGYDRMTELLLENGFDINYVDDNYGTALQAGIYMGSDEVIRILFGNELLNANTAGGYYGCALQVAAFKGSLNNIEDLVSHGVHQDVFVAKSKYGSALQAAARTGSPRVLERILQLDRSQINTIGGAWGTALQAAAKGDYTAATVKLRHLSRGRVLEQPSEKYRKPGNEETNYLKVAALLIEYGAQINVKPSGRLKNPINAAASSGQVEMLKLLLEKNETPDSPERKEQYGRALLSAITQTYMGSESKDLAVQKRINDNRLKLVALLLNRGANAKFTAGNCLHNRPLTAAAAMNDVKVLKALIGEEPNPQADTDRQGDTDQQNEMDQLEQLNEVSGIYGSVLRSALCALPPATEAVLYLLGKGVDTTAGDELYGNVLHLAAFANLPDIVDKLLEVNPLTINLADRNDQTALHIAAYRGYEKVVEKLLLRQAETVVKDVWGDIPLDIVGGVIARESHPVPSLQGLRKIRELLLTKTKYENEPVSGIFRGPGIPKEIQPQEQHPKAKPVYELPNWNPGLQFHTMIVDFLKQGQQEYVMIKDLPIDDLLYQNEAVDTLMKTPDVDGPYEKKLRWIHLPTNNMTWAEMLMKILWSKQHHGTVCKSIWGTDPYFVSPDLAPHARFVTPQCGPLIKESTFLPYLPKRSFCKSTLFFAMPYIHWESFSSQEELSNILHKVIRDISKTKIWRSNENPTQSDMTHSRRPTEEPHEPTPSPGGDDGVPGADNPKSTDYDEELLKVYLYKRWPIHMRRTLDQYYYSYLANTKVRDGDQVAMRARERSLREDAKIPSEYAMTKIENNKKRKEDPKSKIQAKGNKELQPQPASSTKPKHDNNSPVVMIDQLWLWIISEDLVVTSFPKRRSVKIAGDLDPEDKTDVLRTVIDYLHSTKRTPINNAYDLCELVVSQTVGILHRSDMIPDLDFLKIFATQADWAIDQVMQRLTEFVDKYKDFMTWLNGRDKDPNEYVQKFEQIFSVTTETELLREIQDMKDELNMLSAVFNDQKEVLRKVGKSIENSRESLLVMSREKLGKKPLSKDQPTKESWTEESPTEEPLAKELPTEEPPTEQVLTIQPFKNDQLAQEMELEMTSEAENKTARPNRSAERITAQALIETRLSAFTFQQQSEKHASHIKRMQDQANQAYSNLQDLLNFKQQQANVLEARVNRNLTITAQEQNKIILVFTIVTIIFLPLSFITTVFTLPILEFPWYDQQTRVLNLGTGGKLKQDYVFSITFGFTAIMAFVPIMVAFKVRRVQSGWKKIKQYRLKVIPIHIAGKKGIPEPEKEGGGRGKRIFKRLYWGGPEPHRHDGLDSI